MHYQSLSAKIRNVWDSLGATGEKYVLVGGTAIALHLGHRVSFDIDLVSSEPLDHPRVLRKRWGHPSIGKYKMIRRSPDHYLKFFATDSTPKIDLHGKCRHLKCIHKPHVAANGLKIASLTDLLAQKLVAMSHRAVERDIADVMAMWESGKVDVMLGTAAAREWCSSPMEQAFQHAQEFPIATKAMLEWLEGAILSPTTPATYYSRRIQGSSAVIGCSPGP